MKSIPFVLSFATGAISILLLPLVLVIAAVAGALVASYLLVHAHVTDVRKKLS